MLLSSKRQPCKKI